MDCNNIDEDKYIIDNDGLTYAEIKKTYNKQVIESNIRIERFGSQLSGVTSNSLSLDETLHIIAYTGHSAKWINYALRNNTIEFDRTNKKCFIFNLDKALAKVISITGSVVYRMNLYSEKDEEYEYFKSKLNKTICIKQYLSTDKEEYSNVDIVWIITPLPNGKSQGKDISKITNWGTEKEVLFGRNTIFHIDNIENTSEKLYIHMTETM